ncbi:DEAD/DEAH box helicase [Streptomyces sp. NPDC023998]|uniref:DEAD/DEAH box helicase n=1 Tax=Streptomyces sp. NPDC023998 TaxID=3154597 RepID=UPI0033ED3CF0
MIDQVSLVDFAGPMTDVLRVVVAQSERSLATYRSDPGRIQEDANGERRITQGGYGERQLFELVQNGSDEIRDRPSPGRIHVLLTNSHLYCANEGRPVSPEGAETILRMGVSRKRGGQIGRFGVGVKSVLSVTDTPQFFSETGSFGFDREWSQNLVREVQPSAEETPVLRMARPLDTLAERRNDPILDELLEWAVTVVRLPLLSGAALRLSKDIREFPRQFPLFSPHVGTVDLEDRRSTPVYHRQLRGHLSGTTHTLKVVGGGKEPTEEMWQVFTKSHEPTPTAREAAGELHDRALIDISWAVPSTSQGLGKFWAYFPTNYPTTLRGILNAAWKTNEDRQHLLDGSPLNDELLTVAARLVVESLPALSPADDPAAYLPLLPGRSKEQRNWADGKIIDSVWKAAAVLPSLPDQNGTLQKPSDLKIHPEGVQLAWLELWASHQGRPTDWVHPSVSVEQGDRPGKMNHILSAARAQRSTVREWLEALVTDGSPEASACALRVLAEMIRASSPLATEARHAKVLLTEQHGIIAPRPNTVFRRVLGDHLPNDMVYVHTDLAEDPALARDLFAIGIHEADTLGRFEAVVDQGFAAYDATSWEEFWKLARQAGYGQASRVLTTKMAHPATELKVRTVSGSFLPIHRCLLPGPVVPADGSRDSGIAIDSGFHRDDMTLLKDLGARSGPVLDQDPMAQSWYDEYLDAIHQWYCKRLPTNTKRPMKSTLRLQGAPPAGPLGFLPRLSDEGRAAFVAALPERGMVRTWMLQVGAQARTQQPVMSPLRWIVMREGRAATDQGVLGLRFCVGPQLGKYASLLPVARISVQHAQALELPSEIAKIPSRILDSLFERLTSSEDDNFVGRAYALLARTDFEFPPGIDTRCRVGDEWTTRPDIEIAVTSSPEEYRAMIRERVPTLLVDNADDADFMVEGWQMRRPDEMVEKDLRVDEDSEPELLVNRFPALQMRVGQRAAGCWFRTCSVLEERTRTANGTRSTPRKSALQEQTALILTPEDDLEILFEASKAFGWNLSKEDCKRIIELRERQKANENFQRIARTDSVIDKLLLLVGAEDLRAGLDPSLLDDERVSCGAEPSERRVAELAHNAYKDEVLQEYAKVISSRWAESPASFRGDSNARRFVNQLGFPESYAGVRASNPDPMETVNGPTDFPQLHSYQERLATNMFFLLTDPEPRRAMLCLPTGAGKTRVAAEAVIRAIKERRPQGPILWIAQTEELCEQAVQSWKFVWSMVGARDESLTISRLWSTNSTTDVRANAHLVVATDAKLEKCLKTDDYAWLREAAMVIVDEAHTSLSPRYTDLFAQLGIARGRTARPLVGLTATPFRGTSTQETQRLVNRYGQTRLDRGVLAEYPYPELQELGVLARVEQRELPGTTLQLTDSERREADTSRKLPSSVEQRIADDHERNRMLVREIAALPLDWPVLLFATSVAHARLMAAKLSDIGIAAESIDASTPTPVRRKRVSSFRDKGIRVLSNYGVLAQGFDAPATRAVVVARPTYSPNVYQQMIGRGLRGPLNGGKEECLILNVRDNIQNYGHELAFTDFEELWGNK